MNPNIRNEKRQEVRIEDRGSDRRSERMRSEEVVIRDCASVPKLLLLVLTT
jgi:hypothetical protein